MSVDCGSDTLACSNEPELGRNRKGPPLSSDLEEQVAQDRSNQSNLKGEISER